MKCIHCGSSSVGLEWEPSNETWFCHDFFGCMERGLELDKTSLFADGKRLVSPMKKQSRLTLIQGGLK